MSGSDIDPAEARARARYMLLNVVRIVALACIIAGIAGSRNVLPLPYYLAVALAVGGFLAFFFAPPALAKRWVKQDAANANSAE